MIPQMTVVADLTSECAFNFPLLGEWCAGLNHTGPLREVLNLGFFGFVGIVLGFFGIFPPKEKSEKPVLSDGLR